jgi:hypothetical protein
MLMKDEVYFTGISKIMNEAKPVKPICLFCLTGADLTGEPLNIYQTTNN